MDALTQELVDHFPHEFLRALCSGGSQVYAEAWARTYGDPLLGDTPESHDLIGHERHSLYEAHLARTSRAAGIPCPAIPNARGTSFYRRADVGRFRVSVSAVSGPAERPRNAKHREQNAEVNGFLPQHSFAFMEEAELERAVGEPNPIYCIVLHGAQSGNSKEIGFNVIAVPSEDGSCWLLTVTLERLIQLQLEAAAGRASEQIMDKAKPVRRRQEGQG